MYWVDYGGQDTAGYAMIGTDSLQFPLQDGCNVEELVSELQRRCGRMARIKLFKEEAQEHDGR